MKTLPTNLYPLPKNAQFEAIESLSFRMWLDSLIESKPEMAISLFGEPMRAWLSQEFTAKLDSDTCTIWLINDKELVLFVYLVFDKKMMQFRFFTSNGTDVSPILKKIQDQLSWFMRSKII